VAAAFSAWFQLINLAEDQAMARVLLEERMAAGTSDRPRREPDGCRARARRPRHRGRRGRPPGDDDARAARVAAAVRSLQVRPVLTAHPTEAKRRTVLTKLGRVSEALRRLDAGRLAPEDRAAIEKDLAEEVASLWLTDETRVRPPTVIDEVRNGLYWVDAVLFDLVPRLHRDLRSALAEVGLEDLDVGRFLRFGSWIGGDRDGNPFVTVEVTEQALREGQTLALRLLPPLDRPAPRPPVGERAPRHLPELAERLEQLQHALPAEAEDVERRYPQQPHRQFLAIVYQVLLRTEDAARRPWRSDRRVTPTIYPDAATFVEDLRILRESLRSVGGHRIADGRLRDLQVQAEVFGFHLVTLDLRQHARRHRGAAGACSAATATSTTGRPSTRTSGSRCSPASSASRGR
jgi:phosphoenolpyruvate carboxylase